MKNPFPSIERFFKKTGKVIYHGAKSPLVREIAAACFTAGGLPSVGRAIRVVDSAIQGGETWEGIKAGLVERAIKNPEEAALLLELIRSVEAQLRASKAG